MHQISLISIALFTALFLFNGTAAAASACPLLNREDLSGLGINKDTALVNTERKWDETPQVITNSCSAVLDTPAGTVAVLLQVDSFVSEAQAGNWMKDIADADAKQDGVTLVKIGETTCETGKYETPTYKPDGSAGKILPGKIVDFYIACDELVGTRHISLNIQVPEASKSTLPTPEQAVVILNNSVQRIKNENI